MTNGQTEDAQENDTASNVKRTACGLCRKRKLRCDGDRPMCGTCKRLSHDCTYDEARKRSGPKRGYIKLLEARLQQVETLLLKKDQDLNGQDTDAASQGQNPTPVRFSIISDVTNTTQKAFASLDGNHTGATHLGDNLDYNLEETVDDDLDDDLDYDLEYDLDTTGKAPITFPEAISPRSNSASLRPDAIPTHGPATGSAEANYFPWPIIGLDLDEPLPPQDVMDDLYDLTFTKIHQSFPMIHPSRFMANASLSPLCLRYIMWTLAASSSDKYDGLQKDFYQRARRYAEMDEMKGRGEATTTLGHCQAWILMAIHDFKQMCFPRAWLSAGRAVRLAQMMQLHKIDGEGVVNQCLPPPKDWTEREERRRTFWMAFCIDRYTSIAAGWPMAIDERDILTNLPSSEEAFEKSKPMQTGFLVTVMAQGVTASLQPLGGVVLTAALFGRNLLHLDRLSPDEDDDMMDGEFWTRHRSIEAILLNTALSLPDHLRLHVPSSLTNPNVVFFNMSLHTSAICLHQTAIFKADKQGLPANVSSESKVRCVTAAGEIASLMRMISHIDLAPMNPFISFCIYVAARVFVQYLKTRPRDQQMRCSLQFLLQAMQALRRKSPLAQSFLNQLNADIESAAVSGL
ncbi:hypothetical protein VSDG_06465 [Cytospora chrysosperma]|uniref:Zn(2)-C6 fungal-type domain-containing protein n=1 Tax=Cytospora chrysosperma TaxID=252740 RepID=A0A423VLC0_CYTCH|nr:hypothetical protein VSDG_06465 [Valsa sordida]